LGVLQKDEKKSGQEKRKCTEFLLQKGQKKTKKKKKRKKTKRGIQSTPFKQEGGVERSPPQKKNMLKKRSPRGNNLSAQKMGRIERAGKGKHLISKNKMGGRGREN